jgi:hypothetical protein
MASQMLNGHWTFYAITDIFEGEDYPQKVLGTGKTSLSCHAYQESSLPARSGMRCTGGDRMLWSEPAVITVLKAGKMIPDMGSQDIMV